MPRNDTDTAYIDHSSGSSISEDASDSESALSDTPDYAPPPLSALLGDPAPSQPVVESDVESDEWDPEDEDWDLAQGNFTKQYNRMRQLHASSSSAVAAPAINQKKPSLGVALNPKMQKHDKDKSDRATQDQVLDARTRLVLSSLVNRGVIGKIEQCISTGKEVSTLEDAH
jgi:RIO kinase 1